MEILEIRKIWSYLEPCIIGMLYHSIDVMLLTQGQDQLYIVHKYKNKINGEQILPLADETLHL